MKRKFAAKVLSAAIVGTMAISLLAGCGGGGGNSGGNSGGNAGGSSAAEEPSGGDSNEESSGGSSDVDTSAAESIAKVDYDGEPVELTFWGLSTRAEIEDLTEIFNAANENIKVTYSTYDTDGIKDACKTAAQSNSMPSMWFNWGGALGQYYVDNGMTYDLTQYAEEHDWKNTYNPGALSLCTLGGQLSGLPTSYNVIGMYYRTDIFEQNGIEVPTTIEEFDAACKTLKDAGITPISTAGLNGWHVMRLIEQFIEYEAGADLHDQLQSLSTSWDCEQVTNALTRYQTYCQNGYFPDGFITANPDETYMAFAMGSCAMDIQGQWYDANLIQNGVSLDNVSWFPFPNGTGRMSAFAEMTQFNKNLSDDELEAAILYTNYLYSNECASVFPTIYNLPLARLDADPVDPEQNPNVQSMLDNSSENGTFTITDQAFPSEVADVLFNCQDAIANGEMEPAEAGPKIQAAIDSYLSK